MAEKESPTLKELCTDAVISNLGTLASSIECHFSCGGSLPQVETVSVFYKSRSGEWAANPLQLPSGLTGESAQDFLTSCSTASFGLGEETVTDKEYRDALKLEPKCFRTSLALLSWTVSPR